MASLTRWTWVWVNSGSWWWTGRPGVLQFMGLQRVRHDWATELNWTDDSLIWNLLVPFIIERFKKSHVWRYWQCNKCLTTEHSSDNENLLHLWWCTYLPGSVTHVWSCFLCTLLEAYMDRSLCVRQLCAVMLLNVLWISNYVEKIVFLVQHYTHYILHTLFFWIDSWHDNYIII